MGTTNENAFAENTSTLNYWRFLEHAKQVLRTKASQNSGTKLGRAIFYLILLAVFVCGLVFTYSPEGLQTIVKSSGLLNAIAGVILLPLGVACMALLVFQIFFPHIFHGSRFRTKLSQSFFTDAAGARRKEVTIHTAFFSDRIVINKEGIVEEIGWERIIEVTESEHFYFLILSGEISMRNLDKHDVYIRSGIILQKDGFTKGSWEPLWCYLAQFGSDEVKRNLLARPSAQGK